MSKLETTTIWVVMLYSTTNRPFIHQYTAIKFSDDRATVIENGERVSIRPAAGRRVFSNMTALKDHLRAHLEKRKKDLEADLAMVNGCLNGEPFTVEVHGSMPKDYSGLTKRILKEG